MMIILALLLAASIPAAQPVSAGANEISVVVDGAPILYDVPPQIINGRTMVPMRAVLEALGASIDWDGATQTITATTECGDLISLVIGSNVLYINGAADTMDVAPLVISGRTFVPVRFIAQALGFQVKWSAEDNAVFIGSTVYIDDDATPLSAPNFPQRSAIVLPNRELTEEEMNAWKAEYDALGGANELELEIVRLVNQERVAAGLSPVHIDPILMMSARIKAQFMADLAYYSHSGVYGGAMDLAKAVGFSGSVGENLYRGPTTAEWAMQGWMESEAHYKCIMHPGFDVIGVGVYISENGVYHWVQMFCGNRYRQS
jgi:uncharacterized protein YkwD